MHNHVCIVFARVRTLSKKCNRNIIIMIISLHITINWTWIQFDSIWMCDTVESNHGHHIYILILYSSVCSRCVFSVCRSVCLFGLDDRNWVYVSVRLYVYILCTLFISWICIHYYFVHFITLLFWSVFCCYLNSSRIPTNSSSECWLVLHRMYFQQIKYSLWNLSPKWVFII